VTPADLGKPIAAIVERCGPPDLVDSIYTSNQLFYAGNGRSTTVIFDADQLLVRVIQFNTSPPEPSQPAQQWSLTLPLESGSHDVVLGKTQLHETQSAFAADADVMPHHGAAFRSTLPNTVVVGARAPLTQLGVLDSALGHEPLDYTSPYPRDAWLRPQNRATGPRATLFRVDIDAQGIARNVAIILPSDDAAFDTSTKQRLSDANYRPATLEKRPVSGAIFVQVRH
jgi:hypothetical protein